MSAKEVDTILAKHGVKRTGKDTASMGAHPSGKRIACSGSGRKKRNQNNRELCI